MSSRVGTQGGDLAAFVNKVQERLTADNINELDNLILSNLAYADFQDDRVGWSVEELRDGLSVSDFAGKMARYYERLGQTGSDRYALLVSVEQSARYKGCHVRALAACKGTKMWDAGRVSTIADDAQWAALTIDIADTAGIGEKTSVVAFQGTDGTTLGWKEDLELGYEEGGTTAQILSRDYLNSVDADHIILTGHSKGGNDASSAYMMSSRPVRDRVISIYNFDGPGHNDEFRDMYKEAYRELGGKQKNYYPSQSVIGQLLNNNPGERYFINCDQTGHTEIPVLGDHDPFSWEMDLDESGNTFRITRQSELSTLIDRTLDSSLKSLSAREQTEVINFLILVGLPQMISSGNIGELQWENLMFQVMQFNFSTLESAWVAMKVVREMLINLAECGVVQIVGWAVPGLDDLYMQVKTLFADVWRNFRDTADNLLEWAWNGFKGDNPFEAPKEREQLYDFRNNEQGTMSILAVRIGIYSFFIDLDLTSECSIKINQYADILSEIATRLDSTGRIVSNTVSYFDSAIPSILVAALNNEERQLRCLSASLERIRKEYQSTEEKIVQSSSM